MNLVQIEIENVISVNDVIHFIEDSLEKLQMNASNKDDIIISAPKSILDYIINKYINTILIDFNYQSIVSYKGFKIDYKHPYNEIVVYDSEKCLYNKDKYVHVLKIK